MDSNLANEEAIVTCYYSTTKNSPHTKPFFLRYELLNCLAEKRQGLQKWRNSMHISVCT